MTAIGHSRPAAFQATFSDFKLVKTRSVAQLVFEVPVEQANDALDILGGLPHAGNETWVVVARLTKQAKEPEPSSKERRPFHTLPASQQAAMKCREPEFQHWIAHSRTYGGWLEEKPGYRSKPVTAEGAAQYVRRACGVQSRSELDTNPEAQARWKALLTAFVHDTQGIR